MAEINLNNRSGKNKKIFMKKSTRVDLTPMVDLGFLLITFFVFTTNLSKANAMDMVIPNDNNGAKNEVCESCALTVLLGGHDMLYYYEGNEENAVYKTTVYSATGIRNLIAAKKNDLFKLNPHWELQLIIKASSRSTFKNMVDIIDEAAICGVKRYYMVELNEKDKSLVE